MMRSLSSSSSSTLRSPPATSTSSSSLFYSYSPHHSNLWPILGGIGTQHLNQQAKEALSRALTYLHRQLIVLPHFNPTTKMKHSSQKRGALCITVDASKSIPSTVAPTTDGGGGDDDDDQLEKVIAIYAQWAIHYKVQEDPLSMYLMTTWGFYWLHLPSCYIAQATPWKQPTLPLSLKPVYDNLWNTVFSSQTQTKKGERRHVVTQAHLDQLGGFYLNCFLNMLLKDLLLIIQKRKRQQHHEEGGDSVLHSIMMSGGASGNNNRGVSLPKALQTFITSLQEFAKKKKSATTTLTSTANASSSFSNFYWGLLGSSSSPPPIQQNANQGGHEMMMLMDAFRKGKSELQNFLTEHSIRYPGQLFYKDESPSMESLIQPMAQLGMVFYHVILDTFMVFIESSSSSFNSSDDHDEEENNDDEADEEEDEDDEEEGTQKKKNATTMPPPIPSGTATTTVNPPAKNKKNWRGGGSSSNSSSSNGGDQEKEKEGGIPESMLMSSISDHWTHGFRIRYAMLPSASS